MKAQKKPGKTIKAVTQKKETKPSGNQRYTGEEQALIENFTRRLKKAPLKYKPGENQALAIEGDQLLALAKMTEALGTTDFELQVFLLNQAVQTFQGCVSSEGFCNDEKLAKLSNYALAILRGIEPKDEIEGLLAVQMIGVHNLAMEALKRAMITDQYPDAIDSNINRATKLLRTYVAQIEALNRYRGKGQQKVTVEHVHVNAGGQAIVGTVEQKEQGGRGNDGKS